MGLRDLLGGNTRINHVGYSYGGGIDHEKDFANFTPRDFYTRITPVKFSIDTIVAHAKNIMPELNTDESDDIKGEDLSYFDEILAIRDGVIKNMLIYGHALIYISSKNYRTAANIEIVENLNTYMAITNLKGESVIYGNVGFSSETYETIENSEFQQKKTKIIWGNKTFEYDFKLKCYVYEENGEQNYLLLIKSESVKENPAPPWYTARDYCLQILNATARNNKQLVQSMHAKTIISIGDNIEPEEAKRFTDDVKEAGVAIMHGVKDVRVQDDRDKGIDGDYKQLIDTAQNQIYLAYEIPPAITSVDAMTFNNLSQARQSLYDNTALPKMKAFIDKIIEFYKNVPKINLDITLNNSDNDTIMMVKAQIAEVMQRAQSFTTNEIRAVLGKEELPAGNDVYVDRSKVSLGTITQEEIDEEN